MDKMSDTFINYIITLAIIVMVGVWCVLSVYMALVYSVRVRVHY